MTATKHNTRLIVVSPKGNQEYFAPYLVSKWLQNHSEDNIVGAHFRLYCSEDVHVSHLENLRDDLLQTHGLEYVSFLRKHKTGFSLLTKDPTISLNPL